MVDLSIPSFIKIFKLCIKIIFYIIIYTYKYILFKFKFKDKIYKPTFKISKYYIIVQKISMLL